LVKIIPVQEIKFVPAGRNYNTILKVIVSQISAKRIASFVSTGHFVP